MNKILNKKRTHIMLSLLGGLFYASSFPSKYLPINIFGTLIGLTLLFYSMNLEKGSSTKSQLISNIRNILSFSLGHFILGFYWIPATINEFGGIIFPFNWLLGLTFSLIIAPQLIVYGLLSRCIEKFRKNHLFFIISALSLTLLEYFIPQQFPAHAGHTWLPLHKWLGLASIFGAPLFSFFTFYFALSMAELFRTKRHQYFTYITTAIFILTNIVVSISIDKNIPTHITRLRIIQPNIGNYLKVSSETGKVIAFNEISKLFYDLSTKESHHQLDLIIWPETAYPRLIQGPKLTGNLNGVPHLFKRVIKATKAELFTGGYDTSRTPGGSYFETEYNAAFHFGADTLLKNTYRKIRLIPFGESLPFGPLNFYLSKYIKNISYFAKGSSFTAFETKKGLPFTVAICYEILFSSFIRDYLNEQKIEAEFMINLTNDSWYGDTAEPVQHLFLAKWRALEFKIPIIRATNTGISSVIYPDGSESRRTGVLKKEVLDIELKSATRKATFFQKFGIFSLFFVVLPMMAIYFLLEKLKPSRNKS